MNHPEVDQLRRFLAEELSDSERAQVESHVNGCDHCLEYLDSMQRRSRADVRVLAGLLMIPLEANSSNQTPNATVHVEVTNGQRANGQIPAATVTAESDENSWPPFAGYEILSRACCGGMGEIYQARHMATGRIVALKTLLLSRIHDRHEGQESLARFHTEIEAISRLQHPNITAIYEVGNQDGRPFFTMEWIDAGSLADKLRGIPQEERQAARWLATLSRAVHHVHEHGVVHRDLKPGNLLVTEDGTLKITDFGVAKLTDRPEGTTRAQQWLGTPEYMAPEQTASEDGAYSVGPATDVYALGVLLYEMLTGRPPFRGNEPLETLRQIRTEEPVSPRRLRPRLSRDLETICLKCMNKDPVRRYASAKLLADDLERWLAGRPILARPAGVAERVAKWAKRHPERALLVAVASAAVLSLVVAYLWQIGSGNARYTRQLADSADNQLLLVKYAVNQTALDGDLRELLNDPHKNRAHLRDYLVRTKVAFVRWFTRPGENVPIINWFVMDAQGTILADSYEDPNSVGKNYRFRDYYRGAAQSVGQGRHGDVYISRVYESEQDDRFKFTAITRIEGDGSTCGFLGASVAVDSKLVALDMKNEAPGAMLVGPIDPASREDERIAAEEAPPFVVVLHRDYALAGQKPVSVAPSQLARLNAFAADSTLRADSEWISGRGSFLHYARVGDSHFVVMVEHPYPWPVGFLSRITLWSVPVLAMCVLLVGIFWRRFRRKRPASLELAPRSA